MINYRGGDINQKNNNLLDFPNFCNHRELQPNMVDSAKKPKKPKKKVNFETVDNVEISEVDEKHIDALLEKLQEENQPEPEPEPTKKTRKSRVKKPKEPENMSMTTEV
jgi:hypothetical protein